MMQDERQGKEKKQKQGWKQKANGGVGSRGRGTISEFDLMLEVDSVQKIIYLELKEHF